MEPKVITITAYHAIVIVSIPICILICILIYSAEKRWEREFATRVDNLRQYIEDVSDSQHENTGGGFPPLWVEFDVDTD